MVNAAAGASGSQRILAGTINIHTLYRLTYDVHRYLQACPIILLGFKTSVVSIPNTSVSQLQHLQLLPYLSVGKHHMLEAVPLCKACNQRPVHSHCCWCSALSP
jgi:hypothetical protein